MNFMLNLSAEQINEIAGSLECGFRCFYNIKTGGIKDIIDLNRFDGVDDELIEEEVSEIYKNMGDYLEFDNMKTSDSFRVMAEFAERVDNHILRNELINGLNRPKPIRNFKMIIDDSGKFRQEWFDYKKMKYIKWVKDQIDRFNMFIVNE